MYATDESIAETKSDITRFPQLSNMTRFQYAEELMAKTLWFGDMYVNYALNETFIEGRDVLKHQWLRVCWGMEKDANLPELEFHAASLFWLHRHDVAS